MDSNSKKNMMLILKAALHGLKYGFLFVFSVGVVILLVMWATAEFGYVGLIVSFALLASLAVGGMKYKEMKEEQ
jgi:hypothetical protein